MFKKLINLFLLFLLVICVSGCEEKKKHVDDINSNQLNQLHLTKQQESQIETAIAIKEEIDIETEIPAQFKARNNSQEHIFSPVSGKIEEVYANPGQKILKGQKIVKIKSDEIGQIQLEFLEKAMQIESEIIQKRVSVNLSEKTFQREKRLFEEKITSKAEYEEAKAAFEEDKAILNALILQKNSLIRVTQQRLNVYGLCADLKKVWQTKQISPYVVLASSKNGILLERKVNEGEFVEKNKEIFSLADLSTIWLVGYAYEKNSSLLKEGDRFRAVLSDNAKEIEGEISYVSSILDNDTKTLEVRCDVDNSDLKIKPNMYAQMYVKVNKQKGIMVLKEAVEKYGDYSFLFVKKAEGLYEKRKVELGKSNKKYYQILSGISEGETYVTKGSFEMLGQFIKLDE